VKLVDALCWPPTIWSLARLRAKRASDDIDSTRLDDPAASVSDFAPGKTKMKSK
jgi:hypothetical protein